MSGWAEAPRAVARPSASRVLFAVLAVGQLVAIGAAAVVGASFADTGSGDPVIVPLAPAFSIWGLIVALTVAYAIWQALTRADPVGTTGIAAPLLLTVGGFSVWLAVASLDAARFATVPVFAAMGAGLLLAARASRSADLGAWPRWARGLLWGMLGTYGGWTAVAVWVNLATVLAAGGAPVSGAWGTVWQLLIAAAAAGTAVLLTVLSARVGSVLTLVFGLTTTYALAFASAGAATRGAGTVAAVVGVLALLELLTTLAVWRRGRGPGTASPPPARPSADRP